MEKDLPPDLDNPLDEAVLVSLLANPATVAPFAESAIHYVVQNAPLGTSFQIASLRSNLPSGHVRVRPGSTTSYALKARYGPFQRTLGSVQVQVQGDSNCEVVDFPQREVRDNILVPYWTLLDAVQNANDGIFLKKDNTTGAYVIVGQDQIARGDYDLRLQLHPLDQFDLQVQPDGIHFTGRYHLSTNFTPQIDFDFTLKGTMVMDAKPDFASKTSQVSFVFLNQSTEIEIPAVTKVWIVLLALFGRFDALVVIRILEDFLNSLLRTGFHISVENMVSTLAPPRFRGLTSTIAQHVSYSHGLMQVTECPFP